MKTLVISVFYAGLILGMGCKNKGPLNPVNCGVNAQKVLDAGQRLGEDPSIANCEAYKKEVVAFIKSCPTFYTGVQKKELEDFANEPCE